MKKLKSLLIIAVASLVSFNANAGWIVTQQSYDSDEGVETALIETIYLQDNIMKVVQPEMVTMFNLNTEAITLMSPVNKVYWTGKVADYKKEIKATMQAAMEEQLANAAEAQKEMIRKMYNGMMESIDNPSKFAGEEPEDYELQINKTGTRERIAGRMATKYEVLVNGAIKEESWLSESDRANAEFDSEQFHVIFGDFISQAGTMSYYEANEQYVEFTKKGFPLKSVSYYGGYESISEVTNLDKERIDSTEFSIPNDYKKVSLVEIGLKE